MQRIGKIIGVLATAVLTAGPLAAQGREPAGARIPKGYEPPAGMCRVWLSGVPASQQPAPTDCATAIRKRTENAVVVFGQPLRNPRQALRDPIRDADERLVPPVRDLRRSTPRSSDVEERRRTERPKSQRAEPQRSERQRAEPQRATPRTERPPSSTRSRPTAPSPRSTPRRRPPDGQRDADLAAARWLDTELLATLYGSPPGAPARDVRRSDDGRATPRQQAGERGRLRSDGGVGGDGYVAGAPLPWAWSASGERLTALEVERLLRMELAYDGLALPDDGLVEARPGECYDRDFDGRCDDLSAGTDGCYDQNRDGRCDDLRWDYPGVPAGGYGSYDGRGASGDAYGLCFDRDRDGRCDEPWSVDRRIPQTLPEMSAAVRLQRGIASFDVERWLHRTDVQARVADRDGDGLPERITWLDPAGRVVQTWTDRNGDGIADRVELFRDGLPVQVIGR